MLFRHVRLSASSVQCKPLCILFCLKLFADVLAALCPSTSPVYICLLSPRPLPTNMRQDTTPQGRQFRPMDVTCSRDLVEIWVEMLASLPPQMATTPYISPIWPRPLPTIMRRHSTPKRRQFRPMDVTCSRDLAEIWVEMLAPPPFPPEGHHTLQHPPLTLAFTDDYAAG
jgi:hypothetical protein